MSSKVYDLGLVQDWVQCGTMRRSDNNVLYFMTTGHDGECKLVIHGINGTVDDMQVRNEPTASLHHACMHACAPAS